ncbi:MAG: hypothetical protein ACI4C0_04080, partial [Lachnospiraceae bacterium]
SKLRLRLQTVETGHYFCSPMPLRKARKLVKAGGQRYIAGTQIQYTNKKQETWKKLGKILILHIDRKCAFRYYNMRVFAFICPCLDDCDTGIVI